MNSYVLFWQATILNELHDHLPMTPDTAHHSQPPRIWRQAISENNSGFESQKGLKQNQKSIHKLLVVKIIHIYAAKYVYFWILQRRLTRYWGAGLIHAGSRRGYLNKNSRIELCMVDKGFGGAGVFKSRHILLHKYVNRIMITYLWRQIQLIIPSRHGFGDRQYQKTTLASNPKRD
jgi:hypothetical protein